MVQEGAVMIRAGLHLMADTFLVLWRLGVVLPVLLLLGIARFTQPRLRRLLARRASPRWLPAGPPHAWRLRRR